MSPADTCPDCGSQDFVEDRSAGDVVCKGCGLVVEAHIIDERSEWRTFSDKDKESTDPNRVGGPTNPLLEGGGLSTTIGKSRDGDNSYLLNRIHTRSNNPDRALVAGFKKLGDICERMQMASTVVKDSACEIYKMAQESGQLKGRGAMAICAACIYLSCRQNNVPRSFKEITAVMPPEVAKKDIGRCFTEIMNMIKGKEAATGSANPEQKLAASAPQMRHPVDFMRRFAAELRLHFEVRKACEAMALAAKPKEENKASKLLPWDSRSPLSVAAGILYAGVCIKSKEPVSMQDIVMVTNVAQVTIKAVYRELYAHMSMLLPPGVSFPEAMLRLPNPDTGRSMAAQQQASAARADIAEVAEYERKGLM